jgi:3-isopropylmalate dehydrogenase
MASNKKLLVLPGDGIGPEAMGQVMRVVDWFDKRRAVGFDVSEGLVGGAAIDVHGTPLTDETMAEAMAADAVLLGAAGGPKWDNLPFEQKPERGLLRLRKEMDLFANLRPAICFEPLVDASSLKPEVVSGLDILIVRELTGGVYFGEPRESGVLWRQEVQKIGDDEYPGVELSHMYADNCAMQLVRDPKQFDVIVTDNLFGDMLSDEAAMLTGSLGMLPSASLGAPDVTGRRLALYEPVHGSAPDITGQDKANPIASLLSFAMALRYSFDLGDDADLVEQAVNNVLVDGIRTADIMQPGMTQVSTTEMGTALVAALNGQPIDDRLYWLNASERMISCVSLH